MLRSFGILLLAYTALRWVSAPAYAGGLVPVVPLGDAVHPVVSRDGHAFQNIGDMSLIYDIAGLVGTEGYTNALVCEREAEGIVGTETMRGALGRCRC